MTIPHDFASVYHLPVEYLGSDIIGIGDCEYHHHYLSNYNACLALHHKDVKGDARGLVDGTGQDLGGFRTVVQLWVVI